MGTVLHLGAERRANGLDVSDEERRMKREAVQVAGGGRAVGWRVETSKEVMMEWGRGSCVWGGDESLQMTHRVSSGLQDGAANNIMRGSLVKRRQALPYLQRRRGGSESDGRHFHLPDAEHRHASAEQTQTTVLTMVTTRHRLSDTFFIFIYLH